MAAMRVLVCGGRDYGDTERAFAVLDELRRGISHDAMTIICGGANGADRLAWDWCISRRVPLDNYPAEWKKFGKSAGPIRNQKMIDEGKPDLVVAFPGGRGTADMIARAKSAGVEVREVH